MAFISDEQISLLNQKITNDPKRLSVIYRARKNANIFDSVNFNEVEAKEKDGWQIDKKFKYKVRLYKAKPHHKKFEDDLWCQFYDLGFRTLNIDETLELPFSNDPKDKKQIDVIAINEEVAIIIEAKSSVKLKKAPSYKDEFDLLSLRIDGFKKTIEQLNGKSTRIKFVFATRNLKLDPDSIDMERFNRTNSFHHNDSSFLYLNSIIKNYKSAANYQFMGLLFKHQLINNEKIEIPAVEGEMGGLKYYMFSLEPGILLKMGFILHRSRANNDEMPTYQRLLVPSRLKGITKFIDGEEGEGGGFFPNSIIVNFNTEKHKVHFDHGSKSSSSSSKHGVLRLPNAYSIAYIIDGQHRLYGYANSKFKNSNTIPVVAFKDLNSSVQLEMFMNINQNQKAVSPSLRLTLEEDLFWGSNVAVSRLKALRSSIVKLLCISQTSPLMNKISIGEDSSILPFKPFVTALSTSGLLPRARGNKYEEGTVDSCLYDINNNNHDQEMQKARKDVCKLIELAFSLVEDKYPSIFEKEKYFIVSSRGVYAFINILGSLNNFLFEKGLITKVTKPDERISEMEKYLFALLDGISNVDKEKEQNMLSLLGSSADTNWLRFFQDLINKRFSDYNPSELVEWRERKDQQLQDEGKGYGDFVERFMKDKVINNLKILYEDNWTLEIGSIQRECELKANEDMEKKYKQFGETKKIEWHEKLTIVQYKKIIEKYWTNIPEVGTESFESFESFESLFQLDMGWGFNSKSDKVKWIDKFNSLRSDFSHNASRIEGLSIQDVKHLKLFNDHCKDKDVK